MSAGLHSGLRWVELLYEVYPFEDPLKLRGSVTSVTRNDPQQRAKTTRADKLSPNNSIWSPNHVLSRKHAREVEREMTGNGSGLFENGRRKEISAASCLRDDLF